MAEKRPVNELHPDFEELVRFQGRRVDADKEFREVLKREEDRLLVRQRELASGLSEVERRLEHIQALLREEDGGGGVAPLEAAGEMSLEPGAGDQSDPVVLAQSILQEMEGEPVYYRDLARLVMQRGGELPGADPAQVLVSRLVRDDRFVRPTRRGWYALREHHLRAKNVGARKRRARRGRQGQR